MLGYVFELFSSDPLKQLILLSPSLVLSLGLIMVGVLRLRQVVKASRRVIGRCIVATLGAYGTFTIMMLLLPVTATSYGRPRSVIVVFGALYLFSLAAGLVGLALLFSLPRLRRRWRGVSLVYPLAHLAILLLLGYGFYLEPHWLDITKTTVQESKLSAGTPPIKIVLISDIHMERWTRREDEALKQIAALDPDLLIISGDHINVDYYSPATYSDLHRFFKGLQAKYGVYAVLGTVDNIKATREAMEGTSVRLLDDEVASLSIHGQPINIVGITSDYQWDGEALTRLSEDLSPSALNLLAYHTPDLAPEVPSASIDYYLAGHTHGGQIALPFYGAVFTASNTGRKYAAGLFDLGGPVHTKMYVTRGLGMEGLNTPRARLFARPEISLITLVPKS